MPTIGGEEMKRAQPKNAEFYGWEAFEHWADDNGVGKHKDDWREWWECWKAGYIKAMNA